MKIISEKPAPNAGPNGRKRIVIDLEPGEKLLPIRQDSHYRLSDPMDDVIASHILGGAVQVTWCSIEQKWVD